MALDRVKPLKLESIDTGGNQNDEFPTSINPEEDHVECAGIVLDDPGLVDESTVIWRDTNDMKFKDTNNPSGATLTELLSGTGGVTDLSHRSLRHLIHFLSEGGPGDAFGSGPLYCETIYTSNVFPIDVTWWETSAKLKKICRWEGTYNTNKTFATEKWIVYKVDGVNPAADATDTISYTGVRETSRSRAIVVY